MTTATEALATEALAIKVEYLTKEHALHKVYSQDTIKPQPCFVEIDCKFGTLSAGYNPEIGNAVPAYVWHRIAIRLPIPALLTNRANALLDAIAPLAERVYQGHSIDWNGSTNVGTLDQDASDALEEIERVIARDWHDEQDCIVFCTADEWFSNGPTATRDKARKLGITEESTDEDLLSIADGQVSECAAQGWVLDTHDALTYLRQIRRYV